ncbi:MAG TPA: hypothetical protein VER96_10300 [Polyangiaceae bacterium]|nr:hypothetical protein [Polyangiaceae bacterium]
MWAKNSVQMLWHSATKAVPAIGPWGALLLGCLLGIGAFLYLRNARKIGVLVSGLVLLIPISALASVPFIFASGTVADAHQLNADFKAVLPYIGKSSTTGSAASGGGPSFFVFPATASLVAPTYSDLRCVVTVQPYFYSGSTNHQIGWRNAVKIGATTTIGSAPNLSLVRMPVNGILGDQYYSGTFTDVFTVPAGASASFGARFDPILAPTVWFYTVSTVYSCSIVP